jgi:hypothetical protein
MLSDVIVDKYVAKSREVMEYHFIVYMLDWL